MGKPTKELRAKLDELGVKHYDHENGEPLRDLSEAGADPATSWRMDGASVCAVPNEHGTFDLWIDHCTPEQAIAATVGAGTCHMQPDDMLKDLLSALEDEHDSAWESISKYECGSLKALSEGFYDYARLKGFSWGMSRAIFLLKYKAEKAGIEVSE